MCASTEQKTNNFNKKTSEFAQMCTQAKMLQCDSIIIMILLYFLIYNSSKIRHYLEAYFCAVCSLKVVHCFSCIACKVKKQLNNLIINSGCLKIVRCSYIHRLYNGLNDTQLLGQYGSTMQFRMGSSNLKWFYSF